jgi:oxaloacetate decarboxylase alpha subunit
MRLAYERLVAAGLSRFVVLDPMHDIEAVLRTARMIREAGGEEIIAALTYTVSGVHDDGYYAGLAGQMAASPHIDRVYVKDPAGLLTPDRARTLLPAVRARLGETMALELHSHCTIGLSPLTYLVAAELGIAALQVACGPLANGTSLPSAQRVVANLRELGHTVDVDDRLLAQVADYVARLAEAESLPAGAPQEYDASFLRHQVAGGVMTTMRRQLSELGLADRFGAVIAEVSRVRAELGYPIMVIPADRVRPGALQRARDRAVPERFRPGHPLCPRAVRAAHGAGRLERGRPHPVPSPGPGAHGRAAARLARRAAQAVPGRPR